MTTNENVPNWPADMSLEDRKIYHSVYSRLQEGFKPPPQNPSGLSQAWQDYVQDLRIRGSVSAKAASPIDAVLNAWID